MSRAATKQVFEMGRGCRAMKVELRKILNKKEERCIIECVEVTPDIQSIRSFILAKGNELSGVVNGQHLERFSLEDVYYFEAVDEKVFAYTKEKIYEIKCRLYEVEQAYAYNLHYHTGGYSGNHLYAGDALRL